MTDRDYLWCALNLALDREEELAQLCPGCRERALAEPCPACGAPKTSWCVNESFDWDRFERLKGDGGIDGLD